MPRSQLGGRKNPNLTTNANFVERILLTCQLKRGCSVSPTVAGAMNLNQQVKEQQQQLKQQELEIEIHMHQQQTDTDIEMSTMEIPENETDESNVSELDSSQMSHTSADVSAQ